MAGLPEKSRTSIVDSRKYAEIYRADGIITDWGYCGYQVKFINEDGEESFERVVFSLSDIGNYLLVMELKIAEEEFIVNKIKAAFPYDNKLSFKKARKQSDALAYIIAKSKAEVFAGPNNISDFVF